MIIIISIMSISSSSSSSTQRFGLWPMGKTHIFKKKHIYTFIEKHDTYVWQVLFPKTTHNITTNMQHQNQQTFIKKQPWKHIAHKKLNGIRLNRPNEGFIQKQKTFEKNKNKKERTTKNKQRCSNYLG